MSMVDYFFRINKLCCHGAMDIGVGKHFYEYGRLFLQNK